MPLYAYKATTPLGVRYSGYRFGISVDAVYKSLKEEGMLLTDCKESKAERFLPRAPAKIGHRFFQKVPRTLLIDFCHHIAQLDDVGVAIDVALHDLAESASHRNFRTLLYALYEDVRVGIPLSEALARHPHIFDRVFQKLVSTAEQAGSFAPQFRHLENHLRHLETIGHQVRKSVRSPLILLGLMVALLLVMVDFVIPNMADLLNALGLARLPLSTRLLLHLAPLLAWFPVFLVVVGGIVASGCLFPIPRYYLARFALGFPLYGTLALTHFWHTFSVMVGAGLDLLSSLSQAAQVVRNPYLRDRLAFLANEIAAGSGLSETFAQEKRLASPLMVRLLKLSEQTGRLRELVPQAASCYQEQATRQVETMVSWLEPALILVMGGIMMWIVWAVIVPFYSVFGQLA